MSLASSSVRRSPQKKSPPPHLTEFYSYVNGNNLDNDINKTNDNKNIKSNDTLNYTNINHDILDTSSNFSNNNNNNNNTNNNNRLSDPYPDTYTHFPLINNTISRRNNSISHETITSFQSSSIADLPVLVKTQDVKDTIQIYQNLINASIKYKESLIQTSNAASEFGMALEECARCKGSGIASEGLMNSSGLHHLISNHQQILSKSIKTDFEVPLKSIINEFYEKFQLSDKLFKDSINLKTHELRQKEIANHKLSKKKTRNIIAYKSNLLNLASQLDEIDKLKHDHYEDVFNKVQQSAIDILNQSISVIKGESIIYENISQKSNLIYDQLSNSYGNNIEPFKFEEGIRNSKKNNNKVPQPSSPNETLQYDNTTDTTQDINLHSDDRDAFGNNKTPELSTTENDLDQISSNNNDSPNSNHINGNSWNEVEQPVNNEEEDQESEDLDKDESFSLPTPASKGNTSISNDFENDWENSVN